MEAYYHSDPRLEEWINQITEKIFTVCLLTGVDSEVEFQRGSEIVTNVANLLQGISMFPTEFLEDGLKQLLEQQLPDSRVISNFPLFHDTMSKMIREGMMKAIGTLNKENMNTSSSSDQSTHDIIEDLKEKTGSSVNLLSDELDTEGVLAALASIKNQLILKSEVEPQALEIEEFVATSNDPLIPTKVYGIVRKTKEPEKADRLKHVLSTIFPNVSISWNLNLMGQTFLAQVEDILICLHNPEQPCSVESLNKEGWKVYECSIDDLMFPRRLERGIRQVHRFGKQHKIE
ncbi:hypothetical protein [Desulfosporosinus fructosivorans]